MRSHARSEEVGPASEQIPRGFIVGVAHPMSQCARLGPFRDDRIEFCTCRPGAVRTHERFAPAVVRVGFQPAEVGLPLRTRRLGCWLDVQCDVATNPLAPVKVLTVLRESTSLSTARLGRAQNRQHEKAWRNEKIRNGKGLEEGEPTARLPWSCRPTLRILRLPSSPSAS